MDQNSHISHFSWEFRLDPAYRINYTPLFGLCPTFSRQNPTRMSRGSPVRSDRVPRALALHVISNHTRACVTERVPLGRFPRSCQWCRRLGNVNGSINHPSVPASTPLECLVINNEQGGAPDPEIARVFWKITAYLRTAGHAPAGYLGDILLEISAIYK